MDSANTIPSASIPWNITQTVHLMQQVTEYQAIGQLPELSVIEILIFRALSGRLLIRCITEVTLKSRQSNARAYCRLSKATYI